MAMLSRGAAAGANLAPFDEALREVSSRLLAAHSAAVATVEAELQNMRSENTRLRMLLAEAGVQLPLKQGASQQSSQQVPAGVAVGEPSSSSHAAPARVPAVEPASSHATPAGVPAGEPAASQATCGSITEPLTAQGPASLGAQADNSSVQAGACQSVTKPPCGQASAPPRAQPGTYSGVGGSRTEAVPSEDLVQPEIIEEVVTPGVTGSATGLGTSLPTVEGQPAFFSKAGAARSRDVTQQDTLELARALGAVLQHHGLQHLAVSQQVDKGTWTVAGVPFVLRLDGCDLHASCDGGRNWALLEALVVQFLPQLQAQDREAASRRSSQVHRPVSIHEYVRRQDANVSPASPEAPRACTGSSGLMSEPVTGGAARAGEGGLPVWRSDGLPAFHNAFPQAFDASSGSSQYYSQFRVRVPTVSQYESFEQDG
eukprot:TRINITY_DN15618_c0_g1_i1.p1 TRINITY_DN15618_c0_g1~~TRINITY_DN15618_c0_g1_i1.p1  ORF type:complete len:429 (-),score=76.14 TRINITY_DN15618_c0_g1_i1:360-1646(-)